MIHNQRIDPRTKLWMVTCLSTLAVVIKDLPLLIGISIITFSVSLWLKSPLWLVMKRLKSLIFLFATMVFLQSIFSHEGNGLIRIGSLMLLTDIGLIKGIMVMLRMFMMIMCGTILMTSSVRVLIQGLIQLRIPYELAFMVMIGLKWIPLLSQEIRDVLTAIELRGIAIKQLPIRKKIKLYHYMITPVLTGTIVQAKKMAIAMTCKGLRVCENRTSYFVLRLKRLDYVIVGLSTCVFIIFLSLYDG
ncbi:energy-coupling factor transporter transmembrane protein EcfT [Vallitalea pronyensis]|uniref:Energy-coupling factor transporter transmembrane protein EcfT n=1 Tax=Vallitalea pronyensis TaxID=1348613 RepID=A0A8J8MJG9_9FIRM|nr:energy-coupling factor transporter transmembrane component T [Vallitalea pronyensis]QUI22800.1 energy-coupling factor transporter transmembrane protein EcfT [Vallitalea pronyensis]